VQGYETDGSVLELTDDDHEDDSQGTPNRMVVRVAVLAVVGALLAVVVGTAVMVASYWQPQPAAAPASQPPLIPPPPEPEIREPLPFIYGNTVAEVVANGEAAGATVIVFDARWNRQVGPDWQVCTREETFLGERGEPTGDLHVSAVPQGDPCP
jgi:hypothetical protein